MDTLIDTLLDRFIDTVVEWLPYAVWRRRAFAALVLWFAALFLVIVPGNLLGAGVLASSALIVKAIAGWTLLAVTAGLVALVVWQAGRRAVATYRHQMEVRHRHERLHRLSDDEKRVLRTFTQLQTGRFRPMTPSLGDCKANASCTYLRISAVLSTVSGLSTSSHGPGGTFRRILTWFMTVATRQCSGWLNAAGREYQLPFELRSAPMPRHLPRSSPDYLKQC
jgi:hypothetical protein